MRRARSPSTCTQATCDSSSSSSRPMCTTPLRPSLQARATAARYTSTRFSNANISLPIRTLPCVRRRMRARRRAGIRMRMRIISIRVISILRLVYASASVAAGARVVASLCLFNGEGLRASLRDHLYLINQNTPASAARQSRPSPQARATWPYTILVY